MTAIIPRKLCFTILESMYDAVMQDADGIDDRRGGHRPTPYGKSHEINSWICHTQKVTVWLSDIGPSKEVQHVNIVQVY